MTKKGVELMDKNINNIESEQCINKSIEILGSALACIYNFDLKDSFKSEEPKDYLIQMLCSAGIINTKLDEIESENIRTILEEVISFILNTAIYLSGSIYLNKEDINNICISHIRSCIILISDRIDMIRDMQKK